MKYDQHENCTKCGYPGKIALYEKCRGSEGTWEWLKLTCSRCGYSWVRDCLDKEEE
jgi:ribosomal protein L37E